VNPDLAIHRFLSERGRKFRNMAPLAGALEYRRERGEASTLAILNAFVPNEGDAWRYTLSHLGDYYERVMALPESERDEPLPPGPPLDLAGQRPPGRVEGAIGAYFQSARLIGQRTAEFHLALASDPDDPNFAPEPFSALYQRSLYQSMRNATRRAFQSLRRAVRSLPEPVRDAAARLLEREAEVLERLAVIRTRRVTAMRIRIHGDYRLGQLLYTGKDFVIIDFEGESARSVSERLVKRSSLRDVAGMLRSLHYAPLTVLREHATSGVVRPEDLPMLRRWAGLWTLWSSAVFLDAYLRTGEAGSFLPRARDELGVLLDVYVLEKAIFELSYELNHRPDWVAIPVTSLLDLLGEPSGRA
jgi:maltose alpha-D-glucosyltransferase/alpha-amylase